LVTEERKKSIDFSDIYLTNGEDVIVLSSGNYGGSFFDRLANSTERTFVNESRWTLFAMGMATTLVITFFSLVFGTLLGFFVFKFTYGRGRFVNRFTDFCIWIITNLPTVVLLMILFYVIFASTSISGVVVSIIGFSLLFATSVIGMLRVGCSAVDTGEIEAAQAMGFSKSDIFYRIMLPQAINHVISVYKSETITLLKGTAVVGYIAVQDLTKVGDIVRSRTYEAFLPLIGVALFYFMLSALLRIIINVIGKRVDPYNRTPEQILKGVKRQ